MKVLTAAEMREADRITVERGIPSLVLMENAARCVVEALEKGFAPLAAQRIAVICGKGNNGGDGLAIARLLLLAGCDVTAVLAADAAELAGDAAANLAMLDAAGGSVVHEIPARLRHATLVIDALLGTGLAGPAREPYARWIAEINAGFSRARIVAVDIPSGMASDSGTSAGPYVRADLTVTFAAPKPGLVLPPNCDAVGELVTGSIGTPPDLLDVSDLSLSEPRDFAPLFQPRARDANKGRYGHVLLVAGSRGKTGAAALAAMAALRAGAGLVTVAAPASAVAGIAAHAPEIMTEAQAETAAGGLAECDAAVLERKSLVAAGPGLGTDPRTIETMRRLVDELDLPMVLDADALNALSGTDFQGRGRVRVFTPHPGEMSRLAARPVDEIQSDRLAAARGMASARGVTVVLKGQRTVIAYPDGRAWINPSGSPALAKGGTGDVLTGLIAGLMAQFPADWELAVRAAVWIHGRCGELAACDRGETGVLASDLFAYLPAAIRETA